MSRNKANYDLEALFNPDTVAVVGASENPDKLGFHVMKSLTQGGFEGVIVPVNPGSDQIMGTKAFPSISHYPGPIDLVVIVVPAKLVRAIFEECERKHVRGIVLITAGFKEIDDPEGAEHQESLASFARSAGMPVIGPNTFGMINLHKNLNASFTPEFSWLEKGGVTLLSQSGGISHLLAFMAMRQNVKMGKIVGLGNRLNIDFSQILLYVMKDPDTRVIVLYLEGIDEPRPLMEAASACRKKKPVIAFKAGRASTGDQASLSHTGSIAGKQEVYEGAFRQSGILCVKSTEDLLDLANAFAICPLPDGPRVAVLTGQAGPGMAACDVCETEGLEIASFSRNTQKAINKLLPPLALRSNPVDMGPAWYDSYAIQNIVRAVIEDNNVDGILLLMMFASANREAVPNLVEFFLGRNRKKPVVTCLISPPGIWDQHVLELERAEALVNLPTPERAAKVMASLWNYKKTIMDK